METIKLPVTDWKKVPEGATLWRDGKKWTWDKVFQTPIDEKGRTFKKYTYTEYLGLTFLVEVEPAVRFSGTAYQDLDSVCMDFVGPKHDNDIELSEFNKKGKSDLQPNQPYTVIVLKGGIE